MLRIGCHLSSSKGFLAMAKTAESIGATTFQFFTRNPRGGAVKEWLPEDVAAMLEYFEKADIAKPLAHAPYTLNACAKEERTREFALETFADDLKRLEMIPGVMYNFHPGSHVGQGAEEGIRLIADTLNKTWPVKEAKWAAALRSCVQFWTGLNCRIRWVSVWIPVMCGTVDMT